MNHIDIAQAIAQYHNALAEISVKGEDVLRMRDVLVGMRNLASILAEEATKQEAEREEVAE